MNIAFPAVLVLLLVLPGILYRYCYARGPWSWSNPTSLRSVSDELAYSVLVAGGLHVVWAAAAAGIGHRVDFGYLLTFLIGNFGHNSRLLEPAIHSITAHKGLVATYFVTIYVGACVLGFLLHAAVRNLRLDLKHRPLRFENYWFYVLTGETLLFGHRPRLAERPSGVYLSAVVEQGKSCFVYWGIVSDFTFDREGGLDTVVITLAHRRILEADRAADRRNDFDQIPLPVVTDDRFYEVRGDLMSIRYADMKTLNVDYFWVDPTR